MPFLAALPSPAAISSSAASLLAYPDLFKLFSIETFCVCSLHWVPWQWQRFEETRCVALCLHPTCDAKSNGGSHIVQPPGREWHTRCARMRGVSLGHTPGGVLDVTLALAIAVALVRVRRGRPVCSAPRTARASILHTVHTQHAQLYCTLSVCPCV